MSKRRFKHCLSRHAVEATNEEIRELALKTASGDKEAAEQLVRCHLLIAFKMAVNFGGDGNQDEILSEAVFTIVKVVREIAENGLKNYDGLSQFIRKRVLWQILQFQMRNKSIVHYPHTKPSDIPVDAAITEVEAQSNESTLEVEEMIQSLAKDDKDARIVRMLMLGHGMNEVAADVGLDRTVVFRRLQRIREAYTHDYCN